MLGQRRRRWASIYPTLFQCVVFAGRKHFKHSCIQDFPLLEGNPVLKCLCGTPAGGVDLIPGFRRHATDAADMCACVYVLYSAAILIVAPFVHRGVFIDSQ